MARLVTVRSMLNQFWFFPAANFWTYRPVWFSASNIEARWMRTMDAATRTFVFDDGSV